MPVHLPPVSEYFTLQTATSFVSKNTC